LRRRDFITVLVGAVAYPPFVGAQQPKVPVVGILGSASTPLPYQAAFRQGLRDLGYTEGRNLVIEYAEVKDSAASLTNLAVKLVKLKVNVIFAAGGSEATRAARQETVDIPIVTISSNPVGLGFVASLGRPGGNVTGLSLQAPETSGKRLELLQQMVPRIGTVALLLNPNDPGSAFSLSETQAAAATLTLKLRVLETPDGDAIDDAVQAAAKGGADAVIPLPAPLFDRNAGRIAELALKHRLPSVYHTDVLPRAGGLASYGVSLIDIYRRAAYYVDRILKGEKPTNLPVEQPTKFELVINLKTATALGLTVPQSLLARADEVIE
jgi:putative tryptophan/tyrosine transport system substrate-binding protein